MPATARRPKSEAYEKGVREGKAMAARSRSAAPPEEAEEEELEMDMEPGHSRKRSAKGAKHTKPAADGYGMKKPMDAECGCSGKKGGKCDGNCGSMRKRSDSLTPQEYLTACDLGIQDRSTSYIRARLDTAEARNDLKCGKGAISEGEKCHVGPAQKVQTAQKAQGNSKITLTGPETGLLSRERIKREGYYGTRVGGDPFSRKSQAKRYAAVNAGMGAALGGVAGALIGGKRGAAIGAALGGAYGGAAGAAGGAITAQVNRVTSRAANRSLQREAFEKPLAASYKRKRAAMKANGASKEKIQEHDMKTAMTLAKGYDQIHKRTKGRFGADSIWAEGF